MGFESNRTAVDDMVNDQKSALLRGDSTEGEQHSENNSLLHDAVHAAVSSVWTEDSATRREVENYTSQFVKTVPLFVAGRWGAVAASSLYAADEVKTNDSFGMQATELVAGATKGLVTKKAFDFLGSRDWNFASKGMAMGASSRLIDSGLTPSNYVIDGKVDVEEGARRSLMNAGDAKALGVDVLTFGVAKAIPGSLGRGLLANNKFAESTLTGASFGFTSGSLGELQREFHDNERFDFGKVFRAGTVEAGVMGLAAATGFKFSSRAEGTPSEQQRWREKLNEDALRRALSVEGVGVRPATDGAAKTSAPEGAEVKAAESVEGKPREKGGYTGYFLSEASADQIRNNLVINGKTEPVLWTAPERMHITETFGTKESEGNAWADAAKDRNMNIRILGRAVDSTGLEALRVSVDGKTERADGKPYHITRSVAEGRKAAESGPLLERALAVEAARTSGEPVPESAGAVNDATKSGGAKISSGPITTADLSRYTYTELPPSEQFDVNFEPRWRESDTTPKEVKKPSEPKPEIPFEQLNPKLQVINAIKGTDPEYLNRLLQTRTPEQRAGSYFDLTPDQLKQELFKAKWEPYDPVGPDGQPIIGGGAKGYRATIPGGRLGMTEIAAVPETAQLYLIDPKGIDTWSVSTVGASEPHTDTVTMIVGKEQGSSNWGIWTFHPGEPVRPSAVSGDAINSALSNAGISTDGVPANGTGRRIPITRAQLDAINAGLPPDSRMTLAKIESEANIRKPE